MTAVESAITSPAHRVRQQPPKPVGFGGVAGWADTAATRFTGGLGGPVARLAWARTCALFALGLLLVGCRSGRSLGYEPVADELASSFEAIDAAVSAGDSELAEQLLDAVEPRAKDPGSLAAIERLRGTLEGREIVEGFELWLESRARPQHPGRRELILFARHTDPRNVRVELAPSALVVQRSGVEPQGGHSSFVVRKVTRALSGLDVPPGPDPVEVVALEYETPMAGLMALRERWVLEPRDGLFRVESKELPALGLSVRPVESTMLMAEMSGQPIDAEPLLGMLDRPGYLREAGSRALPALLERTVRIPASRAREAFVQVAEKVLEWPNEDLVRIAPVLHWLTQESDDVPGPGGWRRRFEAALEAEANSDSQPDRSKPRG